MPTTALARADRSDHSMPQPPAVIARQLPDISTIFRVDEDATTHF
jgi:hypothetical protein